MRWRVASYLERQYGPLMAIAVLIAVISIIGLTRSPVRREIGERTTKSVVTVIRVPRALMEFSKFGRSATQADLVRRIREAEIDRTWFAVTSLDSTNTGVILESTYIARPGEHLHMIWQTEAVLETLAGRPPAYSGRDYSKAKIIVMPEWLTGMEPRAGFEAMLEE